MTDGSLTAATWFIDADSAEVGGFVDRALEGVSANDPTTVAVALFQAVRDGIRYDPYNISRSNLDYRASSIAVTSSNWCVPKRCYSPLLLGVRVFLPGSGSLTSAIT